MRTNSKDEQARENLQLALNELKKQPPPPKPKEDNKKQDKHDNKKQPQKPQPKKQQQAQRKAGRTNAKLIAGRRKEASKEFGEEKQHERKQ